MKRIRIAPTPSGFIHLGNAINFKLIDEFAKKNSATIILRIDDFDKNRTRSEFVNDIFMSLNWLKIEWQEGPKNIIEFTHSYSLQKKQKQYKDTALKLLEDKTAYACSCTRRHSENFNSFGAYKGNCRNLNLNFHPGETSIRINLTNLPEKISDSLPLNVFHSQEDFQKNTLWTKSLNDFVIWTKEDQAAYQLISPIEDSTSNITHIIRGEDLLDSTYCQFYLSQLFAVKNLSSFSQVKVLHHPLLKDPVTPDKKLSKSTNSLSLKKMIQNGYSYDTFIDNFESYKKNHLITL